jgi:hypothetical protein
MGDNERPMSRMLRFTNSKVTVFGVKTKAEIAYENCVFLTEIH